MEKINFQHRFFVHVMKICLKDLSAHGRYLSAELRLQAGLSQSFDVGGFLVGVGG